MSKPHSPFDPASSADEDPTGVRALLSGLPEPAPMPAYLLERITASLNAEQSQRAATFSGGLVTPLVPTARRRPGRVLFAIAGAAAVVLVAVVGTNLFGISQTPSTTSAGSLAAGAHGTSSAAPPEAYDRGALKAASSPASIQIRASSTRYTQAGFPTQARMLAGAVFLPNQPEAEPSSPALKADEALGLSECLRAVGVADALTVRADLALYEGTPAVIVVATTKDGVVAYALGRECSLTDPAVLHPATPLP